MEVAVVAGFSAKRDMNINSCHVIGNFCKIVVKMAKLIRYTVNVVIGMLIYLMSVPVAFAQNPYSLVVRPVDKDSVFVGENLDLKTSFSSQLQCRQYIEKLPVALQTIGYIACSIDSISFADSQAVIFLYLGDKYNSVNLRIRKEDMQYLEGNGWERKFGGNTSIPFLDYQIMSSKLLDHFEDNGYPFAKVYLDSVKIENRRIHALLNIEKGFPYHIDSIRTFGPGKISRNFIHHYLDVEKGSLYNKGKLDKINQRLLELPYLEQSQPWDLSMLNTGSLINLYLRQKKSNQINVLAGFLPSNQQLGGKLLLTVDANLKLNNAFGGGEQFGLLWQQLQPKSPKLHLVYTQPYIFNSPFSGDFLFELNKRDSSFLNIIGQIGLLYMLSGTKTAKVLFQTQKSNVLQIDTVSIKSTKKLPDVADVSSWNVGINYDVSNTDYRFNPRKGNDLTLFVSAGNKTIKKNNLVTQIRDTAFDYNRLYDSVKPKTYQMRFTIREAHYFKLGTQSVLKTGLDAGYYLSSSYFRNELFQIGGYRLLRGFNEESIYTNRYLVGTIEYRYLLGLNSNFFVFSDMGVTSNNIIRQSNSYIGAGGGLSFRTPGGIFNLSYAVGRRDDTSFDIKQSKIHFGYVSIF
jgi:hypothetical protein